MMQNGRISGSAGLCIIIAASSVPLCSATLAPVGSSDAYCVGVLSVEGDRDIGISACLRWRRPISGARWPYPGAQWPLDQQLAAPLPLVSRQHPETKVRCFFRE
jgi:hypothetical protein